MESFHDITVLALVLFPIQKNINPVTGEYFERELSQRELLKLSNKLRKKLFKPVYLNGVGTKELAQTCVDYFREE